MKITIIGTAYLGLVMGTCLAKFQNDVICVDIDEQKVEKLKNGVTPIYEPRSEELIKENVKTQRQHLKTSLKHGVMMSDIIYLSLPTPDNGDGPSDLPQVVSVSWETEKLMQCHKIIVNKSTVPVETTGKIKDLPVNDPIQRQPDISKAVEILNWRPNSSRSRRIGRTIKYFTNELAVETFVNRNGHRDFSVSVK